MPNGEEATKFPQFPKFPTLFTEEDESRLRELEEQRKKMETVYQAKFTPEAWSKVPFPEKVARELIPAWTSPLAKVASPWEWGWEFGYTPEQAQERRSEVELEYKELVRKQKVTKILPSITDTLRALALSGQAIMDASELRSIFKLSEMDFTEDEIAYITSFAQKLLYSTPEEIASGEVFEQKPMSPEDVEELARRGVEPSKILTTISISKNLDDITAALRGMYAPQVEPTQKDKLITEYVEKLKEAGITKDSSVKMFEAMAESEGRTLILTDDSTGTMIAASRKPDNTVYIEDELVGYYDENTGNLVPINLQGQPMFTQEAKESALKDLWDAWYLGANQAGHMFEKAITTTIPDALLALNEKALSGALIGERQKEARKQELQKEREYLRAKSEQLQREFDEWLKEHPELAPRPEYTQDPFEHKELWTDPYWYAYTMVSNAPIMATALGVGVLTTMGTANPLAGAAAGAAVITPIEIQSVQDDLLANGADPDSSSILATLVGTAIGAVEIFPGMVALKIISPVFMRTFGRNLQRELTRNVVAGLTSKGALGVTRKVSADMLKIMGTETLEEVIQESMQNAAVKTVNEERSVVENLPQVAVQTFIATLPLGLVGGAASYTNVRASMPESVGKELDETADKMEKAGLTREHAEAVAVSKVMETEKGKAGIEAGIQKEEEQVPPSPDIPAKVKRLEDKLETLSKDIDEATKSVAAQEEVVKKTKGDKTISPSERLAHIGSLTTLEESLYELEKEKIAVEKNLKKMYKEKEKAEAPPKEEKPPKLPKEEPVEPISEKAEVPTEDEGPKDLTGRPRIRDWEDEREIIAESMKDNPNIARFVKFSEKMVKNTGYAKDTWQHADEELRDKIREDVGLRKSIISKDWDDLTPTEQQAIALSAIPDRTIKLSPLKEIFDIRYYMQFLQEETGLPFYNVFKRAEYAHGSARIVQEKFLRRIGEDPLFDGIRTDEAALSRVAQEINSRHPQLNVESPPGLTENELHLANVIEAMYKEYENKVRYLRVMRTTGTFAALKEEFPDAPDLELGLVEEVRARGNLDDLWNLLKGYTWGVINTGFDPWIASYPNLRPTRIRIGTARGAARLMRRESVEYPELQMEKNVLLRLATYLKQMEVQWQIEPELNTLDDLWHYAGVKFSNLGQIQSAILEWQRELQGIPTRNSVFDRALRRLWRQSMSAVFLHPWMSFRNAHQPLAFHPDRLELSRVLVDKVPPALREKGRVYYDSYVSQLKGIRRDWLYTGERGLPGMAWLTRLGDKFSLYSHSDNVPRRWSFEASLNKAQRATNQFRKDGDTAKWIKNSGAAHLRQTEINYALELLSQENHDLAVPGLRNVSGDEMASLFIAHEVTNMTHFIYERAFRAPVEYGATGRTLYNLIVFPRSYFQRMYFQGKKMPNMEEVFSREANWEQARAGFKDIIMLTIVGMMVSQWLKKVTGRPRRAYNPADIIQWQLGGLVLGVGLEVFELIGNCIVACDSTVEEDYRREVMSKIPGQLVRQADVLIPFYRNLIDSFEAATGTKNWDVHKIRELRALIDDKYTPEDIEEMDRNLWEKLRKAVLAGEPPDPTAFQALKTELQENQARLGEMDGEGNFYTLRQFGSNISSGSKEFPDDMLTEDYGFSELVVFYKECEDQWKDLYKLPSSPSHIREDWRKSHIEEEAMLLFWGKYARSVFRRGTPEWEEVSKLLETWFSYHEIDKRMHTKWADWTLIPGEDLTNE